MLLVGEDAVETWKQRLTRFISEDPRSIFDSLINSIHSFLVPQLKAAVDRQLDDIFFLGTHAIIQTVSENIYGYGKRKGEEGTRFYLKHFVDGVTADLQFSRISNDIHEIRNVIAHRWFSRSQHNLVFDRTMPEGWLNDGHMLRINPAVYAREFFRGFDEARFWDESVKLKSVTEEELLVRKYQYIRKWLDVDKNDDIAKKVSALDARNSLDQLKAQEAIVKHLIAARYAL